MAADELTESEFERLQEEFQRENEAAERNPWKNRPIFVEKPSWNGLQVPEKVVPSDAADRFNQSIASPSEGGAPADKPKSLKWSQIWQALHPIETKEEQRQRQRKERSRLLIKSIGDGLSAVANLVGTSTGAPNVGTPNLTARQAERMNASLAERKRNRENYINGYIRAQKDEERENLSAARESRLREKQELEARKQLWRESDSQGKFDYYREKLRIEEEYKKGIISHHQAQDALNELKLFFQYNHSRTKNVTTDSPKGTTVRRETTSVRADKSPDKTDGSLSVASQPQYVQSSVNKPPKKTSARPASYSSSSRRKAPTKQEKKTGDKYKNVRSLNL